MTRIIKKPEVRRNEILDAAQRLFNEKGYRNTSIQEILEATGIAKGTFYYYFKSKSELMDAIVLRFITAGAEAANRIAADTTLNAEEKILRIISEQNRQFARNGDILDQLHVAENVEMHQKSNVAIIHRVAPVIGNVVRQGIKEGRFSSPYPLETVEFLLAGSQFLLDESIFHWKREELHKRVRAFVFLVEKTLNAKQGSFAYIAELYEKTRQPEKNSEE